MRTHNKVLSGYTCIFILLPILTLLHQKTYNYCTKSFLTRWELLSPLSMTGKGKMYKGRQNPNIHHNKVILLKKVSLEP